MGTRCRIGRPHRYLVVHSTAYDEDTVVYSSNMLTDCRAMVCKAIREKGIDDDETLLIYEKIDDDKLTKKLKVKHKRQYDGSRT